MLYNIDFLHGVYVCNFSVFFAVTKSTQSCNIFFGKKISDSLEIC